MESRILVFLLRAASIAAGFAMLAGCAGRPVSEAAGDPSVPVIEPQVERREIREPDIDTENFELGAYVGFMSVEDFGSNSVFGARLAYHVSEHLFIEGTWGRTDTDETSFEKLSGGAKLLSESDRELSYYDVSIGYNLLPGEVFIGRNRAYNSALYVLAGAGNTNFGGDDFFTLVFGAGYRILPTDSLAVHFDVRDHLFDSDILGDEKTTHNIEFNLGMTFYF